MVIKESKIGGEKRKNFSEVLKPDLNEIISSLEENIIGQSEAIKKWAGIIFNIINNIPRFGENGPRVVLTEIGPSGVGKTEVVYAVSRYLHSLLDDNSDFNRSNSIIRIDGGEYRGKDATNKLIGSGPGFRDSGDGSRLDQKELDRVTITLPNEEKLQIILFDEIEKTNPELSNLLLSALDSGDLTMGLGAKIDFRNSIFVFTSNLGNKEISLSSDELSNEEKKKIRLREFKKHFSPEQIGRMGGEEGLVIFDELSPEESGKIILKNLAELEEIFQGNIMFSVTPNGLQAIINRVYSKETGVRSLEAYIKYDLLNHLGSLYLNNNKHTVLIDARDDGGILLLSAPLEEPKEDTAPKLEKKVPIIKQEPKQVAELSPNETNLSKSPADVDFFIKNFFVKDQLDIDKFLMKSDGSTRVDADSLSQLIYFLDKNIRINDKRRYLRFKRRAYDSIDFFHIDVKKKSEIGFKNTISYKATMLFNTGRLLSNLLELIFLAEEIVLRHQQGASNLAP